jgi:hypothetical protein
MTWYTWYTWYKASDLVRQVTPAAHAHGLVWSAASQHEASDLVLVCCCSCAAAGVLAVSLA